MGRKKFEEDVAEFAQAVGLMVRRVRAAAASSELSLTESAVLTRLDNEGAATIAELARAESVKPQSMGATVAALEKMELVERKPHPTDGRQMRIELTAKGMAMRKSTKEAKRTWIAKAMARLDESDQETLFKAGKIMRRISQQ